MKKKNKIYNIIMVFALVAAAALSLLYVGSLRGWFSGDNATAVVAAVSGNANIERAGIGYSLKEETALDVGDIIETLADSSVKIRFSDSSEIVLDSQTELTLGENGQITLSRGLLFGDTDSLLVALGNSQADVSGCFSCSVQGGADSLFSYRGESSLTSDKAYTAEAGSVINVVASADGSISTSQNNLSPEALSEFILVELIAANENEATCYKSDVLESVRTARAEEIAAAEAARREREAELLAQGGNVKIITSASAANLSETDPDALTATITIRCETILDNMGNLTEGKGKYVPSNGVILAASTVQFTEGDTVFDVLKAVCEYSGIQLEYAWTPLYDSYYIEGINNLYEFDCGELSGWMYKVNGWFPNYGASAYKLKAGDVIVWAYTCNDLGADVGAGDWM